jgi:hypothetical protein
LFFRHVGDFCASHDTPRSRKVGAVLGGSAVRPPFGGRPRPAVPVAFFRRLSSCPVLRSARSLTLQARRSSPAGHRPRTPEPGRADPSRAQAEWQRSAQGTAFIAGNLKVGNSHLLRTEKGRGGATWGHWQIGLAYAQHLSPRFHALCARTCF